MYRVNVKFPRAVELNDLENQPNNSYWQPVVQFDQCFDRSHPSARKLAHIVLFRRAVHSFVLRERYAIDRIVIVQKKDAQCVAHGKWAIAAQRVTWTFTASVRSSTMKVPTPQTRGKSMSEVIRIGIDRSKSVFVLYGVDQRCCSYSTYPYLLGGALSDSFFLDTGDGPGLVSFIPADATRAFTTPRRILPE